MFWNDYAQYHSTGTATTNRSGRYLSTSPSIHGNVVSGARDVYRRLAPGAEAHCGDCRPVTKTRLTAENASGD